ncbi:hypothetical protein A2U01_0091639, partial [Trifolium medium]|nr:hypothetical protein [Trifolium medium]
LKASSLPLLRNRLLICLGPCDCVWIVLIERAFMSAACSGVVGTWIIVPCWRLIHSPF